MNELTIKGTQKFLGKEIPVVYGGFGSNQKVVLAKTIAEIHEMKLYHINENINNNIKRFKNGVDIIDLKQIGDADTFSELGFTKAQRGNAKNIYLLSERGYAKLIKIMDSDLAWDIHDQLMDEYFTMREEQNNVPQLTSEQMSILKIVQSNSQEERMMALVEYKEVVTAPLVETIEKQAPKVEAYDTYMNADGTYTTTNVAKMLGIKPKALFNWLRDNEYVYKNKAEATVKGMNKGYFKQVIKSGYSTMVVTPDGVEFIRTNFRID